MKVVGSEMREFGGGVGAEIYSEFLLLKLNPQCYAGIVRKQLKRSFYPINTNDKHSSSGTRRKNLSVHLKISPVKQLLASFSVSGEPSPICQDHPVVLMRNNAGEKMLCRNFCIWNVQGSLRPESFLWNKAAVIDRDWTRNANLFFKELKFPFLNRVSISWINGVNGRLNNILPEKMWNLLGKNTATHYTFRYVI